MGGKTGTTTQSVQIPPEVLARYNAVNARAETTAQQPFQQYSQDPSAFVAQLNPQQQQGISNINQQAMAAQPAYQAAMRGTAGAYGGFTPEGYQQGVQGYMSPFLQNAMGSTAAYLANQQAQQRQELLGKTIAQGAFGGDRGKIAQAALAGQQNLATGQTLGQMAQQGYQDAARNYMAGLGQQGALAAQMGALGAGAQQAGLQGAQAQIGAGTLGQQTEQAGKTALYNQFLQQQAYPFQVAQFLANIAMGTGALSGSTTTTTQPMPFFSDRRLKEDVKRIGESDEGLPIYKYKYKGDPNEQTHIGFMADEVEKKHPEAVGIAAGYKTVDYDKATSEGGAVHPEHAGVGFADGGLAYNPYDPYDIHNILTRQQSAFSALDNSHVPASRNLMAGIGKHGRVPEAALPVGSLKTAGPAPALPQSGMSQGISAASELSDLGTKGKEFYSWLKQQHLSDANADYDKGLGADGLSGKGRAFGGIAGYAMGGTPYDQDNDKTKLDIPTETDKHQLAVAGVPPGQSNSGMSDLANIAKFAMMFMKDGGRAGYATDGAVEEDPRVGNILSSLSGIESGGKYDVTGPSTRGDKPYGKYQIMGANVGPWTKQYLGQEMTPEEFLRNPESQDKLMRARVSQQLAAGTSPEDIASIHFTGRPVAQAGNRRDVLGTSVQDYLAKFNRGMGNADMPASNAHPAQSAPEGKKESGGIFSGDTENWAIPLLTGLGAMASSNSPYAGSAILQGIGAGAQSYLDTQRKRAAIEQTKQETEAIKAEMARSAFMPGQRGNIMWVIGPNGQAIPMGMAEFNKLNAQGRAPRPAFQQPAEGVPAGTAPPAGFNVPGEQGGAPAAAPTEVGGAQNPLYDDRSRTAAQNESSKFDPTVGGPQIDNYYKLSGDYINRVSKEADAARANGRSVQELGSNLAKAVTLSGGATPGPGFDIRANAYGIANVIARAAGLPEIQAAEEVSSISDKLRNIQAFAASHGADQNSLGALNAAIMSVPNPNMSPKAFAPLAAMLMVQQKRAIDAKNHADSWGEDSGGTYLGASSDFSRKTSQLYADDQNALSALMMTAPKMFQQFMNGVDSRGNPIDEARMVEALKASGFKPRVAKYFVLGE